MSSMEKIEAERTVDRLERDAETLWQIDGRAHPLTNMTNDTLRDALIDTLADVAPMRKLVGILNENASEAVDDLREAMLSTILDPALRGADESELSEVNKSFERCNTAHPSDLPGRLVELLSDVVAYYRQREPAAVSGEAPAILQASLTTLPTRTKRQRTGSTTAWLPFLFDHVAGENVAVNDPLPSSLGPVVTDGREKKKRTKASVGEKSKAA